MRQGLFPCSPKRLTYFYSLGLLQMYSDMLDYGAIHQETFAKDCEHAFCGTEEMSLSYTINQRSFSHVLARRQGVRFQREPNLSGLRSLCLCCFGVGSSCFVCLDGNFQHRRFKNSASWTTVLDLDSGIVSTKLIRV